MRQVNPAVERSLDYRPGLRRLDPAVVAAFREHDEVSREAVATDVCRLPDPLIVDLLGHGVVERPAVPGATAVVLAVRADEEEWVLDPRACAVEIHADQVIVPLQLEPPELARARRRAGDEGHKPVAAASLGPSDEEDPCVRQPFALGAQVRLQIPAQRRPVDGVVCPEPAILDQDPRVDTARGRRERLGVCERRLGAKRVRRPGRGRSPARSRPRPRRRPTARRPFRSDGRRSRSPSSSPRPRRRPCRPRSRLPRRPRP